MLGKEKNVEFIIDEQEQQEKKFRIKKETIRSFLDGTVLTRDNVIKQLPYILFIAFLALIYIGNRYHAEKIIKETISLQTELKELRSRKISTSSDLMNKILQSKVAKRVDEKGLKLEESLTPPQKIIIEEKDVD